MITKLINFYKIGGNTGSDRVFLDFGDDPRSQDFASDRGFEPTSLKLAQVIASFKDTFLDVGAHTGAYSICIAEKNQRPFCYAFEPNPLAFSRLVLHTKLNGLEKSIQCVNLAISDRAHGTFSNWYSNKGYGWISSGTTVQEKPGLNLFSFPIFTVSLDSIFQNKNLGSALIKMDVEGHEVKAFAGAHQLINNSKPDIILETFSALNASEIQAQLPAEYRFYKIYETQQVLKLVDNLVPADPKSGDMNILLSCDVNKYVDGLAAHGINIT